MDRFHLDLNWNNTPTMIPKSSDAPDQRHMYLSTNCNWISQYLRHIKSFEQHNNTHSLKDRVLLSMY